MGCPSFCFIDDNLTFSICTHDPDTGVLTDADAVPAFRVYEDETGAAIANGNMAKLDDDNTTGFYAETLAVTAANGYENGKSYTVYIEATVDSDTGGICFAFKVLTALATTMETAVDAGLDNAISTPTEGSLAWIAHWLAVNNVYKMEVDESTGEATLYDKDDGSLGSVATRFTSAGGTTTRLKGVV